MIEIRVYTDAYFDANLRCPRCGSRNIVITVQGQASLQSHDEAEGDYGLVLERPNVWGVVRCKQCGAQTPCHVTEVEASEYKIEPPLDWEGDEDGEEYAP